VSDKSDQMLMDKVVWLREQIAQFDDPINLASLTGFDFLEKGGIKFFKFKYFDQSILLLYPDLIARNAESNIELNIGDQAVISYYCYTSIQPKEVSGQFKWIAFSELSDGRIYEKAFQGYTGDLISKSANNIMKKSGNIISSLNAQLLDLGDFSIQVTVLPYVSLAMVTWFGDEDFPPSCKILFNNSINSYLPTDACAIIGSMFTRRIIQLLEE
jgi:hypothetical protein